MRLKYHVGLFVILQVLCIIVSEITSNGSNVGGDYKYYI